MAMPEDAFHELARCQLLEHVQHQMLLKDEVMRLTGVGSFEYDPLGRRIRCGAELFANILGTTVGAQGGYEMGIEEFALRFLPPEADPGLVLALDQAALGRDPRHASVYLSPLRRSNGTVVDSQWHLRLRLHAAGELGGA